tara:strand:- start:295 stop:1068 length:774 start_codon:yes stop_codon:yes gene_type:complete
MNFEKSLVSIIIPYYKKKKYFEKTLKSICNQSYKKNELIIIYDDNDKSELYYVKKLLKKYKKKKTRIIINQQNLGVGRSRNKGIKISKGKFIAFCDADDIWKKDKLKKQIKFMTKNKIPLSHCGYEIIDTNDRKIGSFIPKNILKFSDLIKSCDIGLSTVVINKNVMRKFSFSNLKTKEDYLLWLKLINNLKIFHGMQSKLVNWRKTDNSLSSSIFQKFIDAFRLYKIHMKYNFFLSLFFVIRLTFFAFKKKILIYL